MTKFEEFEKAFEERYEEGIYEFMNERNPDFGGEEVEDLDQVSYDSYGSEDSILERIYYFRDFDIYVKFEGTRCSYQGEEWDTMREVKQVQKTITTWE